jgi:hypothetical protein
MSAAIIVTIREGTSVAHSESPLLYSRTQYNHLLYFGTYPGDYDILTYGSEKRHLQSSGM